MFSSNVPPRGLVRIRRLVRARADAVADRMRRLSRVADPAMRSRTDRSRSAIDAAGGIERTRLGVHSQQLLLELGVFGLELAEHEVLRVVGPVPVGADPDLEEDRLALDDRQVGRWP